MTDCLRILVTLDMTLTTPYASSDVVLRTEGESAVEIWIEERGLPMDEYKTFRAFKTYKRSGLHYAKAEVTFIIHEGIPANGDTSADFDELRDEIIGEWCEEYNVGDEEILDEIIEQYEYGEVLFGEPVDDSP